MEKDIRVSLFHYRLLLGDVFYYNHHYVGSVPVPFFLSTFHRIATWEITSCYSTLNIIPPCCLEQLTVWEVANPGLKLIPQPEMRSNTGKSRSAVMSQEGQRPQDNFKTTRIGCMLPSLELLCVLLCCLGWVRQRHRDAPALNYVQKVTNYFPYHSDYSPDFLPPEKVGRMMSSAY